MVEILVGASFAAAILQFCQHFLLFSLPIGDFFGKVDVPDVEGPAVDVLVNGPFGAPDFNRMGGENVVDGLAFHDEGRNEGSNFRKLLGTEPKPFSAFFQGYFSFHGLRYEQHLSDLHFSFQ